MKKGKKMKVREASKEEKSKGGFKERRLECINKLSEVNTVDIKGKKYSTVAIRHQHLINYFPESKIDEQLIDSQTNDSFVTTKTTLYIGDTPYSVGHARESFNSSFINKTSAVENAFTSSLGRCLAAFGLHGSEFASAEEVANAINNQPTKKDSIEVEIEKQSTETKLNTLYSNWITKNEKIDELFKTKQESIKTNGGKNAKW
jgi:hypothetical protein